MGYERNIVCDFCGARQSCLQPIVPMRWVTLSGELINSRTYCGLACAGKDIAKLLEQPPVQARG